MALDCRRKSPRWLRLLLDVVLVSLYLLLDMRDLWFKLRWVGPLDTFAFSTVKTLSFPAMDAAPLKPTTSFSYADQKAQRVSGWSSFLDKCESLTPILEEGETRGFRYALGRNCAIGTSSSPVKATELFITSSIRVDSMAWAACELLYKNRKPPICHSAIVTQFQERYNFQPAVALNEVESSTVESTYVVAPGGAEEAELTELLEVISKSSPISGTVCVEGFAIKGLGRYSSSVFGCGSPSFYGSVFVGIEIAKIARNQAWLTSSRVGVTGMSLLVRENRRSVFTLRDTTKDRSKRTLEHRSLVNVSASGSLYIAMVLVDIALLVLGICSVVEICQCMLWPLWKPLIVAKYQTSSAQTTKLGFDVENYTRVLQIGLLWSSPVALLTVVSRLLTWMLVVPISHLWGDGVVTLGDIHAFLTMIRLCDLVVIFINAFWSVVAAFDEKRALAIVRQTFVSPLEITGISVVVAMIGIALGHVQGPKQPQNWQQSIDHTSFENASALANTFAVDQNSYVTSLKLYYPLVVIIGVSALVAGVCAFSRFRLGKLMPPRSLVLSVKDSVPAAQSSTAHGPPFDVHRVIAKDITSSSAGILMRSVSPPPSPTKAELTKPTSSNTPLRPTYLDKIGDDRLLIESLVDIPIRARSIIRRSWALEKFTDGQLLLLPASYLKFGIILTGKSIKTRCGFMDVVQPLVYAKEHEKLNEEMEDEPPQLKESNFRPNLRSFVTVYDPDGRTLSVKDFRSVLKRKFESVDTMKSTLAKMDNESKTKHSTKVPTRRKKGKCHPKTTEHRQRYRLRQRIRFTSRKASRSVNDMHQKLSSWLAQNYYSVLLPSFQTSEMVRRDLVEVASDATPETCADEESVCTQKRKLRSPTARAMMAQVHYRFKILLKYKMNRAGGQVIDCEEEYTSKTCSCCGEIKKQPGWQPHFPMRCLPRRPRPRRERRQEHLAQEHEDAMLA